MSCSVRGNLQVSLFSVTCETDSKAVLASEVLSCAARPFAGGDHEATTDRNCISRHGGFWDYPDRLNRPHCAGTDPSGHPTTNHSEVSATTPKIRTRPPRAALGNVRGRPRERDP